MGQSVKAWIGVTVVVALLVVVAGWFLYISPTRQATANVRAETESEQNRTLALNTQLDTLKAQAATLDESLAELDALKVQVPTAAETAAFRRTLADRAAQSGITILSITTAVSAPVEAPAEVEPPPDTDATEETDFETADETATPEAEDAAATAATTATNSGQLLVGIPLQIAVMGTYDAARAFIASLQTTEGRLFLVTGLGIITQNDGAASSGRPETVKGDVEVAVQGMLFVITPDGAGAVDPEQGEEATLPPLPSTERNPFVPVG